MPHGAAPLRGVADACAQWTPLHVVPEVLGHAGIAITKEVYGHLLEGDKRAAAEAMSATLFGPVGSQVGSHDAPGDDKGPARVTGKGL